MVNQLKTLEKTRQQESGSLQALEQTTEDTLYQQSIGLAEREQTEIREALKTVTHLIAHLKEEEQRMETRRRRSSDPSKPIAKGSLVAALTAATPGAPEEWILATVLSYDNNKHRYTVQDYDQETPIRPTYVVPQRKVLWVTTPDMKWDKRRNPEMPQDARVLALYPGTTAFYQGVVVRGLEKGLLYRVVFEDDEGREHEVEARWVIPVPD